MRVLVFLHSFEPGGVERVALRLAGAWADLGHDVRLVMGRDSGPQRVHAPRNVTYDFARPSWLAAPFETLWMVAHLLGAIRRHRPEVLFCAGSTYTIVAILMRLILGSDCPPIVCKLSNSLERRDLPAPARLAYRAWLLLHTPFIDLFVGMAEPMREEIQRCLRVTADRVAIVPDPAIEASDLRAVDGQIAPRRLSRRFVAIGRMNAQKNLPLLLRAFAAAAEPHDRLLILGDGPKRRRLESLAARLGIDDLVEMPGHVHSVADVLAGTDVFVLSSDYEGVPAAVLEALASGIPIIATDCSSSMKYLLGEGRLGRLVPVRDEAALSGAMRDAPRRDNVSVADMQAMAAQFTIERAAGSYLELLCAAASSSQVVGRLQPVVISIAEARSAIRSSASSSPMCSRMRLGAGDLETVRTGSTGMARLS
jgi:glycosyltransferase involved in cell wall biosynthesis